jgi:hypothetical protein
LLCQTPAVFNTRETGRRARTVVTGAVVATLAATLVAAGPGSRSPALAADATPPTVTITSPASGTHVPLFDDFTIEAEALPASADKPVASVTFFRGGQTVATDTTAPYQLVREALWYGAEEFTAVALDGDGIASLPATVEVISYPKPGVFITQPNTAVLPVDGTATVPWHAIIIPQVNEGRDAGDPIGWIENAFISVDGILAQTVSGEEGCAGCPAPGRPTTMNQAFTWNAAETGRGAHTIQVRVVDSFGFEKTASWTYTGVNRPMLTLRGVDGAVLPETMRLPAGSVLSFDAEVGNDELARTTTRSVDLYVDGRQQSWPVPCSAPAYCPASVVVREDWNSVSTGMHELRIVATDQWGVQGVATVHVDVYPGTSIVPCYYCSNVKFGKPVTLTARLIRYETKLGEPGRQVTVQWRPVGAGSWQTLATRTTSSTGGLSVLHTPRSNGSYRLTYAGIPDTLGGAVTTVPAIVHPKVKVKRLPRYHEFEHRTLARIHAQTSPAESGAVWYLQRWHFKTDRWVTVDKRRIHANGNGKFAVRVARVGKLMRLRILRPATARYGDASHNFNISSN